MVVLGSVAFSINARAELLEPASATQAPSPDCIIKGNINRHGERIYFRPGQLDYVQVNMTKTKASPIRKLVESNEKPIRLPFHFD